MQNLDYDYLLKLSATSSAAQVQTALQNIGESSPDPIELEKCLRAVAKQVGVGLKAVKHSYNMLLKKLNLKPVDLGLTIAKQLLESTYGGGALLKLTKDGFLFAYVKTHWIRMSTHQVRAELQEIAAKYKDQTEKTLHSLVNDALGSLHDYLGSNEDVLSLTDEPPPVINCLNGELWIGSDGKVELRQHKPESQLLYCLPIIYDENATCPKCDEAILEIFAEGQEPHEMQRHAYELMGYAIQPSRPFPCFWLLIGHGANGKTKFLQTLSRLISPDYLHNVEMASFGKDKFSTSQLQGKLLMIDDDIKMDTVIPDGLLKKVSESKLLSARQPYGKQAITFRSAAMPVMVGNHYPICEDLSEGLLRRAMVIPFMRQFSPKEQDNSKFEYIWAEEMSGVLNRAIQGFQRVVKRKQFSPPQECIEARHEFLAHGNPFYCFLMERVEKQANARIMFPELRQAYELWAKAQNISSLKVLNKTLKRRLQGLGYEVGMYNGYSCINGYQMKVAV